MVIFDQDVGGDLRQALDAFQKQDDEFANIVAVYSQKQTIVKFNRVVSFNQAEALHVGDQDKNQRTPQEPYVRHRNGSVVFDGRDNIVQDEFQGRLIPHHVGHFDVGRLVHIAFLQNVIGGKAGKCMAAC